MLKLITLAAEIISFAIFKGIWATDFTKSIGRVLATSATVLKPAA